MEEEIQINLSKDEAVILFEFLLRFSAKDKLELVDQSETRVLWNIHCDLEKTLIEPFSEKYSEILEDARKKIRDVV